MTIEELAQMIQKQFAAMDEKFDHIDAKFERKIDQLRVDMNQRFDHLQAALSQIAADLENIKERVASIEEWLQKADLRITANKEDTELALKEISEIKLRLSKLESKYVH